MTYLLPIPDGYDSVHVMYAVSAYRCQDSGPLTVDQAHAVMREHLECMTDLCRVRRTARAVLVTAGHMTLDSGRRPHWVD